MALYDHFLGPNNIDHMAYEAEKIIQNLVYHWERKNNTFESYVTINKEQHTILKILEYYGYNGID